MQIISIIIITQIPVIINDDFIKKGQKGRNDFCDERWFTYYQILSIISIE